MPPDRRAKNQVLELLVTTARRHAELKASDEVALRNLQFELKTHANGDDVVCQGERPDVAVFIVSGMLARYHTVPSGDRQYLSLHIAADMPDVQSLFLKVMDHSVCALNDAEIACFRHEAITRLIAKHPLIGFAFWRITLVDAAIFRQAITNNSARAPTVRLAHFCCEMYFRAREAGLLRNGRCDLPLSQSQLGQLLGMSHISLHRALQTLRHEELLDIRDGMLEIFNWREITRRSAFDPTYLHAAKES